MKKLFSILLQQPIKVLGQRLFMRENVSIWDGGPPKIMQKQFNIIKKQLPAMKYLKRRKS